MTIIIDNVEYETGLHTEMDSISKIKIPEGWRLLTFSELMMLWNEHRNECEWGEGFGFDEVVEQPIKENRKKYPYWNVWFLRFGVGGGSDLGGDNRNLHVDYGVRGVRFARDVKQ